MCGVPDGWNSAVCVVIGWAISDNVDAFSCAFVCVFYSLHIISFFHSDCDLYSSRVQFVVLVYWCSCLLCSQAHGDMRQNEIPHQPSVCV